MLGKASRPISGCGAASPESLESTSCRKFYSAAVLKLVSEYHQRGIIISSSNVVLALPDRVPCRRPPGRRRCRCRHRAEKNERRGAPLSIPETSLKLQQPRRGIVYRKQPSRVPYANPPIRLDNFFSPLSRPYSLCLFLPRSDPSVTLVSFVSVSTSQ